MSKDLDILLSQLHRSLIVSCQAEEGFPLNKPEYLAALAKTAVIGGAQAIRASRPDNILAIREVVDVPIIGIYKKDYPGYAVRITPTLAEVEAVVAAGADIVALDATHRPRPDGYSLEELFQAVRARFDVPLLADVATVEEGIFAAQLGADLVATTLSGYTSYDQSPTGPNIQLVRELADVIDVPVIAEGRIKNPDHVQEALDAGAFAVVVGSVITRPHVITEKFAQVTNGYSSAATVIALDIGGTKIAGGVINNRSQIMLEKQIRTPVETGPVILERIIEFTEQLKNLYDGPSPSSIGVSTGGQIDAFGNIIGASDMIQKWKRLPLKQKMAERFKLPTTVLNDGHAAALAELMVGAGRGRSSLLCLVIGTGLGGGLVIDGHVRHGANGLAGSLGQMKMLLNGRTLPLEAIVSGPGLVNAYNARVTHRNQVLSGQQVAKRAQDGDLLACNVIKDMGETLGLGLAQVLHLYDVSCIVIGGSVAQIGSLLFDSVRSSLQGQGHSNIADTPIIPAHLGTKAGLVGAAIYSRQQISRYH